MSKLPMSQLLDALAALDEDEQLELCDALLDDPRLRELLETIDDYLTLESTEEAGETPPPDWQEGRELN